MTLRTFECLSLGGLALLLVLILAVVRALHDLLDLVHERNRDEPKEPPR